MKKRGITPEQAESIRLKRGLDRGTKLRIVRVERGLTQSELADRSGIPVKTLQRYEQEPNRIDGARLNTLCSLSEALDCRITEILEDEELSERLNRLT
jgi:transcriptional regulator with XRE-family HTH domain